MHLQNESLFKELSIQKSLALEVENFSVAENVDLAMLLGDVIRMLGSNRDSAAAAQSRFEQAIEDAARFHHQPMTLRETLYRA